MEWQTDEFADQHDGRPAAVLPDGSEPGPLVHDIGSGSEFHETSDWWIYDGTLRAPKAAGLRAACSCGWRGAARYPIDWEEVVDEHPYRYDTSGPRRDWQQHITDVEARTVPLPAGLAALPARVDEELEHLADEAPLAALRAIGALERTTTRTARTAAYNIKADEVPTEQVAAGLGMSERSAASRLSHYHYRH